ncbi:Myb-like dna-binding protein, partial [Globisporangium splendens]
MSKSSRQLQAQNTFRGVWSQDEHDLFLEALQLYPQGPWKLVASHIGTRSVRQVQTHAQKYHEKVARRLLGLRKERKKAVRSEHRIDDDMMSLCRDLGDLEHNGRLSSLSTISTTSCVVSTPCSHHSCESCGARTATSSVSSRSSSNNLHMGARHTPFEFEYDEVISFGEEDTIEEDENEAATEMHDGRPPAFGVEAEAAAARHAAQHRSVAGVDHEKKELPSFSDCMDFIIDFFHKSDHSSSSKSSSAHMPLRHHRWGK